MVKETITIKCTNHNFDSPSKNNTQINPCMLNSKAFSPFPHSQFPRRVVPTDPTMDATIPTPTACSTVTNSSVSTKASRPFYLLDISLISAQDLTPINKSMRTYAVAWIKPSRKLNTRTDQNGHTHPTWNEKLTFRVDSKFLTSEDAALNVEIYTTSWFREVLVGTVQVLISDLLLPTQSSSSEDPPQPHDPRSVRFVTLQVRGPSGAPQGMLNMGVALLDSSTRSMTPGNDPPPGGEHNALGLDENEKKTHLWRSLSVGSGYNPGSVVNGDSSMVNGSDLCSDIGPSASIVAADLAKKCQPLPQQQVGIMRRPNGHEETGSSIVGDMTMEEAEAKGYRIRSKRERCRKQDYDDHDERSDLSSDRNEQYGRRNSDGGMFSCFGTAYGIEFRIVCGNHSSGNKKTSTRNAKTSDTNSA